MLPGLALAQAPAWRADGAVEGMSLWLRKVPGAAFEEIRVSTTSGESLEALCDAVWNKHRPAKPEGNFKQQTVIRESETERWTYEQIRVPVVSDRDYVMFVKLEQPASSGRCEVSFETRTDEAYPPRQDHVRIAAVRGHWLLEPIDDGKVRITYDVFSDPGGSVPPFLAWGGQRDAAVAFMKTILARARAARATAGAP
jgi:hypothetical protein